MVVVFCGVFGVLWVLGVVGFGTSWFDWLVFVGFGVSGVVVWVCCGWLREVCRFVARVVWVF